MLIVTLLNRIVFTTNNRLPIETGRWLGEDRICPLCDKNVLGDHDEFHYLLDCNFFDQQGQVFIPRYYYTHDQTL